MCVQSDTLLLPDIFQNFRNMCFKIYKIDPEKKFSAPGLTWLAALKKINVKFNLLTDIDMLLMVEKGIRGETCHSIFTYAKANNKYMSDYDKNNESSYLKCWVINNLYGSAMLQKLPVNNFEWVADTYQLNKDSCKTIMKKVIKDIFLKWMFNILKNYMNSIMIYHFY